MNMINSLLDRVTGGRTGTVSPVMQCEGGERVDSNQADLLACHFTKEEDGVSMQEEDIVPPLRGIQQALAGLGEPKICSSSSGNHSADFQPQKQQPQLQGIVNQARARQHQQ